MDKSTFEIIFDHFKETLKEHMKKSQEAQRETYFERHKYECCKSTFQNAEHVIKTMRATNAVLIDAYYDRYPFAEYAQNYIRYVLAFMRISENQAEYQECVSAGELAYMYSISRCRLHDV